MNTSRIESLPASLRYTASLFALKIAVGAMTLAALAAFDGAKAQSLGYAAEPQIYSRAPNLSAHEQTYDEPSDVAPAHLRKTIVAYATREAPGTIVIDTDNTYLYYVLGQGRAIRYGVGVGREGFTWSGQSVSRKAEWPDWVPPAEMIARQPYLPRWVGGGPGNPLGARAMYLGSSIYRIHGTNDPTTIGKFVSSGCIRMTNDDVADLYTKVNIGTKVVVLPRNAKRAPDIASINSGRSTVTLNTQPLSPYRVTSGIY